MTNVFLEKEVFVQKRRSLLDGECEPVRCVCQNQKESGRAE